MDKILTIKLSGIFLFLLVALLNFDQHFITNTDAIYTYGHVNFMVATLCFGVIISAAIYNLALYIYVRSIEHLYYTLAQLSTLFFLINLDSIYISPFDEIFQLKSTFLFDISQIFMLFFSILFIQAFLNTHTNVKLQRLIHVILYLSLVDLLLSIVFSYSMLTKFIPIFIPIWLILSEAKRLIKEKDLPFYFLYFGWGIVLFTIAVEYLGFVGFTGIVFPFLHVAFALESLILSLAIAYKFKRLEEEKTIQQSLMLQQSRLASMGEMISIVAHQWRQPLTFLSFSFMHINKSCPENEKVKQTIKEANEQIHYMSQTIEDFSNFYNPSKIKESFSILESCENVHKITNSTLEQASIMISIDTKKDFYFYANQNEFEQVILNIITNAKDMLIEREIKNPRIMISIDKPTITITDNAGGIEKKNLSHIFEPYFTTKSHSDGIGLYIAKIIIEKEMRGILSVNNDKEGACFTISLPTNITL